MQQAFQLKQAMLLTLLLVALLCVSSICGIFLESTYSKETPSFAAQGIGQDVINLVVAAPILLITGFLVKKGSKLSLFIWNGALIYTIYSYIIYCFGVHFNSLFLVYCGILSLSFYAFIYSLAVLDSETVKGWFDGRAPVKLASLFFFIIAIMFYFLWLKEILPALIHRGVPESIKDTGMLTNPIHILDIAILLPALIISALLLMKRKALGFILAPSLLVFSIVLSLAIGGMIVAEKIKGFEADLRMTIIFAFIAVISGLILFSFLKHCKK